MKNLFLIIVTIAAFSIFTSCEKEKSISINELPAAASNFIDTYFSDMPIALVKYEKDGLQKHYEVFFNNGESVKFDKSGNWVELQLPKTHVPTEVIPGRITEYLSTNYPDTAVLEIEKDKHGYELKLSNRIELQFDKNQNIMDIDM